VSDERLRELERRAAQTGTEQDRAALLTERHRTGSITELNLRLAAYCGDTAAAKVLNLELVRGMISQNDVTDRHVFIAQEFDYWLGGLSAFGSTALIRACVAPARLVGEEFRKTCSGCGGRGRPKDSSWLCNCALVRVLIDCAEKWANDFTSERRGNLVGAFTVAKDAIEEAAWNATWLPGVIDASPREAQITVRTAGPA